MKKNFFILLINFYVFSFSQTVLLDENFESYQDFTINNIGNWQTLDLDLLNTWTFGDDPAPQPIGWQTGLMQMLKWLTKFLILPKPM